MTGIPEKTGELTGCWTPFHATREYQTEAVKEGCDPDELFEEGWYVLGGEYVNDGEADVVIRIEYAYDSEGYDVDEQMAHLIADALRATNARRNTCKGRKGLF